MSRWVEGKVVSQKKWTSSLYSLYVSAPIEPFTAGQFTQIGLRVNEKILFRPYSFVNTPDSPILEFYYTHLPKGELTSRLIHLQKDDTLYISRKGSGRFTLGSVPKGDSLWLMATGTGLGVFLSLLRTEEAKQRFAKVVLVHSVRQRDELTHKDLIASIQQQWGTGFHYISVVTREEVSGTLNARIPVLIQTGELEQSVNVSLTTHSQIMLCGNPSMVKDVSLALKSKGLERITVESYWKE